MYHPLIILTLLVAGAIDAGAHPGSGIVVDLRGHVFFTDTGGGVWRIDEQGHLLLYHRTAYHWMALDAKGQFATSRALGSFDGGEFLRITPEGARPAILISSDYPIVVGEDGGLHYVPYNRGGQRQIIRRMPDGTASVRANLPTGLEVNGIATGPEGSLYLTDDDAIRRIDKKGSVSTVRATIQVPDCSPSPLPDTPKGPYLRGLTVQPDGTIIAAATGCRGVIRITSTGSIKTILKAEPPWSPTGVALSGKDIYVLEYLHTPGDNRNEWMPRVRKIGPDGNTTTIATVTTR